MKNQSVSIVRLSGQIDPEVCLPAPVLYVHTSLERDYGAGDPYNYALTATQIKNIMNEGSDDFWNVRALARIRDRHDFFLSC